MIVSHNIAKNCITTEYNFVRLFFTVFLVSTDVLADPFAP